MAHQNIMIEHTMPITYHKNSDGDFVCPHCGVIKKRQNSMHYHMKKHMDDLQHVCKLCKKGFLQKQTLDLHIRSKHPELLEIQEKATAGNTEGREFKASYVSLKYKVVGKVECYVYQSM